MNKDNCYDMFNHYSLPNGIRLGGYKVNSKLYVDNKILKIQTRNLLRKLNIVVGFGAI